MIFAYFGRYMALEQMRIEVGVSRDGCNAGNMMRAAKRFGLDCRGFRKETEDLRTIETPCIIHWYFNHFVVLEGIKRNSAYINDPASGKRKIPMDELDDGFTGIVLVFDKTDTFVRSKKQKKLAGLIKSRLDGQQGTLFKLMYMGLLLVFPGILLPVLSQLFMDEVLTRGNMEWFIQILIFMLAAIALNSGLTFYRSIVLHRLQTKLVLLSGRTFLSRLFRLPIGFFDQRYAGDLIGRTESNNDISRFLAGELAETVLNILIAAFFLILLLIYNVWLTLIGIISIAVNLLVVKYSSAYIASLSMKLELDGDKYSGALLAGLSIISTLKATGAENEYAARTIGHSAKVFRQGQKISRLQEMINAIPGSVELIVDVVILVMGALFIIQGSMTIGMLFAFLSLFSSFSAPVKSLVGFVHNIQQLKVNISRVDDIMEYKTDWKFATVEHDDKTNKDVLEMSSKLTGNVELGNISFGYSILAEPLIENFRFRVETGNSIAFVGSSGCGKSTVSKIISGLYQPWNGDILLDGININSIPSEIINASIATVSQNIVLFSGSVRDNLTMWNRSVLMSDIIAAAKDACIHDLITQKPGAYDYHLEENGANFSGGQRQRLEIARALATNPSVIIMDEATSAMDPLTEKQILDNIKRRGCTCIIVAHRLSAIRDCDEIIVMEQGRIVQRGKHDELCATEGRYKSFIQNA